MLVLAFTLKNWDTRSGYSLTIVKEFIYTLLSGSQLIYSSWYVLELIFLLRRLRLDSVYFWLGYGMR